MILSPAKIQCKGWMPIPLPIQPFAHGPSIDVKTSLHLGSLVRCLTSSQEASMCAFKSKIVTKIISPSGIGYLGLEMVRRGNRPLVTTYAPTPETTPRT